MGKKKQRTVWSSVENFQWNNQEENESLVEDTVVDHISGLKLCNSYGNQDKMGSSAVNSKPNSGNYNRSSSLAPRFERKSVHEDNTYYDGEYCEEEHLPDGFTKIRSKNLDILFKKDYYQQKLALLHKQLDSEKFKDTTTQEPELEEGLKSKIEEKTTDDFQSMEVNNTGHIIEQNHVQEFKPIDDTHLDPEVESGASSPEYPQSPYPVDYSYPANRPNLYLYSPSNNTLIPCEEIILPTPVMSPDGPVYPGPTNIYLAYPGPGQDGSGYVTQPFTPNVQCPSYVSQDSYDYSPSASYDGSNYYSSAPQTPNSGLESGTTTQPTSPPPLIDYHPNNWFYQEQSQTANKNFSSLNLSHSGHKSPSTQRNISNPEQEIVPRAVTTEEKFVLPTPSNSYIPGLPVECQKNVTKKSQKRKKKKSRACEESNYYQEHRGSTSSESEVKQVENNKFTNSDDDSIIPVDSEEILKTYAKEITITDDLTESLLNPPTDIEISEDENKTSSKPLICVTDECYPIITNNKPSETLNIIDEKNTDDSMDNLLNDIEEITESKENLNNVENKIDENQVIKEVCDDLELEKRNVDIQNYEKEDKHLLENTQVDDLLLNINSTEKDKSVVNNNFSNESMETVIPSSKKEENIYAEMAKSSIDIKLNEEFTFEKISKKSGNNRNKLNNNKSKQMENQNNISNLGTHSELKFKNIELNDNEGYECTKKSYSSVTKPTVVVETDNQKGHKQISQEKQTVSHILTEVKETEAPLLTSKEPVKETLSDNWVKTSTRRKKRNNYKSKELNTVVNTVTFSEVTVPMVEEVEKSQGPELESFFKSENNNNNKNVVKDDEVVENAEPEKKKIHRKKKKKDQNEDHQDDKDKADGRKVIICDDQIEIKQCQTTRNLSHAFVNSQQGQTYNYSNMLVVSELGQGMSRGSIGFGRLYQGKYVPPERKDGLYIEENKDLQDDIIDSMKSENQVFSSGDIDLD